MSKQRDRSYYRDKLTIQQQRAAELLVDNEFGLLSSDGKKLTMEQVAEMAGIAKSTLYLWKKDPNFIAYKNLLADDQFETHREQIYKAVLDLALGRVGNKVPSVKALDLYMRRFGLLSDRVVIENDEDPTKIPDLDELKRMVAEMDGEE
jgi:AcrR family transcriptional regulator